MGVGAQPARSQTMDRQTRQKEGCLHPNHRQTHSQTTDTQGDQTQTPTYSHSRARRMGPHAQSRKDSLHRDHQQAQNQTSDTQGQIRCTYRVSTGQTSHVPSQTTSTVGSDTWVHAETTDKQHDQIHRVVVRQTTHIHRRAVGE